VVTVAQSLNIENPKLIAIEHNKRTKLLIMHDNGIFSVNYYDT